MPSAQNGFDVSERQYYSLSYIGWIVIQIEIKFCVEGKQYLAITKVGMFKSSLEAILPREVVMS